MKENKLQQEIIKYSLNRGAYVINNHGSSYSRKGVADLVICYKGLFVAVEVKIDRNKPTKAQKLNRKWVMEAGGTTIMPYTLQEFIEHFEDYINGKSICDSKRQQGSNP